MFQEFDRVNNDRSVVDDLKDNNDLHHCLLYTYDRVIA